MAEGSIFLPNIFLFFDYDLTLTEESAQDPIFRDNLEALKEVYKDIFPIKKADDYWEMLNHQHEGGDREITYLQNLLRDIERGVLIRDGKKLTAEDLFYYGSKVKLSPGVREFLVSIKEEWKDKANIEIYIISVGMMNLIKGAELEGIDGIYASELVAKDDCPYVNWIHKFINSFSKTSKIIEVAKGKDLNAKLRPRDYRLKYENCLYFGDGMSDLSAIGYLRKKRGKTVGVYESGNMEAYLRAHEKLGAYIDALLPRDYTPGGKTHSIINCFIQEILDPDRCIFPGPLLHMDRKGEEMDEETKKHVQLHYQSCRQCSPAIFTAMIPPS
mgnify:CR=1 FL=1